MVVNGKPSGRTMSMAAGLALGGCISLAITLILSAVGAKLMDSQVIPEDGAGYLALGILLLASVMGAAVAYRKIRRQRLVVCMASGGIYYGILISITALFFGGQYRGMGVTALVVLAGAGTTALVGMGQGRGHRGYPARKVRG